MSHLLVAISNKQLPNEKEILAGNMSILDTFAPQKHKEKYLAYVSKHEKSNFSIEFLPYHRSWEWLLEPAQNAIRTLKDIKRNVEDDHIDLIYETLQKAVVGKDIHLCWKNIIYAIQIKKQEIL